jgi:hypothetical protein
MTGDRLKSAVRDLADEIENVIARCRARVDDEVFDPDDLVEELTDLVDEILESEKAPQQEGFLLVSVESLTALRVAISDLSGGDVDRPFADLDWEMRAAFRQFKEALIREPPARTSCTPQSAGASQ